MDAWKRHRYFIVGLPYNYFTAVNHIIWHMRVNGIRLGDAKNNLENSLEFSCQCSLIIFIMPLLETMHLFTKVSTGLYSKNISCAMIYDYMSTFKRYIKFETKQMLTISDRQQHSYVVISKRTGHVLSLLFE